jgi:hypothetical protein
MLQSLLLSACCEVRKEDKRSAGYASETGQELGKITLCSNSFSSDFSIGYNFFSLGLAVLFGDEQKADEYKEAVQPIVSLPLCCESKD